MTSYKPPLKDIEFLIKDVLKAGERTADIPLYAGADWEMSKMILDGVSDYAVRIAMPLNKSGDLEGCTYTAGDRKVTPRTYGQVKTPKGFKEGYDAFRDLGIIGMSGSGEFGGSDQPHYLGVATKEILTATNFSLASYGGLTGGAAKVLEHFATEEIKKKYLPMMYAGIWTGTMCLTEPEAGSDLGALKSTATPQADGSYAISGTKIFITCGEHDLSGNICHLVLARLPGAPEGTAGISLFLVPKHLPDDMAGINGVECLGIEHKMGIHASATCTMGFENAKGFLIGSANKGMNAMFTMMNDARLNVGIQGLGMSDFAFQNAAEYASTRIQGKLLSESFNPKAKNTEIINHANIRKDLSEMKAQIDGFRALAYDTAVYLDIAEKHPDADKRKAADQYTSLMTPILKACMSDMSCATAQKAIQIHGGNGFITDYGIEQYYRDSLIGTIYEGTNDIQGMDFTFRKALKTEKAAGTSSQNKKSQGSGIPTKGLAGFFARTKIGRRMIEKKVAAKFSPMKEGTPLSAFGLRASADIAAALYNPALKDYAQMLQRALNDFTKTVGKIGMMGAEKKADDILIHSRDFMDMFGKLAVGHMWLKMMATAVEKMPTDPLNKSFYESKLALGDVYMRRTMQPEIQRLKARICGAQSTAAVRSITNDAFMP